LAQDHDLVFTTESGTPLNRHNLRQRSFKALLKKAKLPEIRFHALRHTCATLLLTGGVHPKIVQELLGHSTIAVTLDTYSHVLPGMRDAAAGAMDEALGLTPGCSTVAVNGLRRQNRSPQIFQGFSELS
jgi:integrase